MSKYPKKFLEWLLNHSSIDIDDEDDFERKWVIMTETHVLDYFTTKEAFRYWKKNIKST